MANGVKCIAGAVIMAVAIGLVVSTPEKLEPFAVIEKTAPHEIIKEKPDCIKIITTEELLTGVRKTDWCVGNVNTKKFHDPYCNFLPYGENQIVLDNYDFAIELGFEPCAYCGGGK